jgi:hypothetical protein
MANRYDVGIQKDFDSMTAELGTTFLVLPYQPSLNYEGQETEGVMYGEEFTETGSIQELDSKHEVVSSGEFSVGDVRLTLPSSTKISEEDLVEWTENVDKYNKPALYKILSLTRVRGMGSDVITHVKAYGKKMPSR